MEVDYPLLLPHEVLYNLTTNKGMHVKLASCVEAMVRQMLGVMHTHLVAIMSKEAPTLALQWTSWGRCPYTKWLKSASVICST